MLLRACFAESEQEAREAPITFFENGGTQLHLRIEELLDNWPNLTCVIEGYAHQVGERSVFFKPENVNAVKRKPFVLIEGGNVAAAKVFFDDSCKEVILLATFKDRT